jgi:hypothetical protein
MERNEEYYENLDKRTKEYKEWKANKDASPSGLGDSIEKITEATERKERLNRLIPYKNAECFTEDEYNELTEIFNRKGSSFDKPTQETVFRIYNRVFNRNQKITSCGSCRIAVYNKLKGYYERYQG